MDAFTIRNELLKLANSERAALVAGFFKTGPGQYAEGDYFWGLTMLQQRLIARRFRNTTIEEVSLLVQDPVHECRMTGLLIWVEQVKRAGQADQNRLINAYLAHRQYVNNWDLVDVTSPNLLGRFLLNRDRSILYELADEAKLWSNRMALVSTLAFIRRRQFADTFSLTERLLTHPHDLIHKAMRWMLREVGKQNTDALNEFLHDHLRQLPRTTLRYAIERMPIKQRQDYLNR